MRREQDILDWAVKRQIIRTDGSPKLSSRIKQFQKTYEEQGELLSAIASGDQGEACDAIGDVIVTLIIQAAMWGLTMDECLEQAWSQIQNRTGKMVDGLFVKDNA